jgi:thioredoxin reductase (NADPH)
MANYHEAVIVGGGPAGLTAGIYLMRAGIGAVLLEKGAVGGTPMWTDHVENYPGFPEGITGSDLMGRMVEQAKRFGLIISEFTSVEKVTRSRERFEIRHGEGTLTASGVIAAVGTEPARLGIPGEMELAGRGVSYCATCDGMFFRDAEVAVVGGGDAAIQEALMLANLARHVYIVHRRGELRAQKILQDRVFKNSKLTVLWNRQPSEIKGKDQVESMILKDTQTGELSEVPVSGVFFYVGSCPSTTFLGQLVERDESGFILAKEDLSTSTPGLFVAGDARKKTLRQVTTAVGDGALAAVGLEQYILESR